MPVCHGKDAGLVLGFSRAAGILNAGFCGANIMVSEANAAALVRLREDIRMAQNGTSLKPKTITKPKLERPKLYKIILVNDDYTPREFVIMVLKAVFRMSEETGYRMMMTAHKLGVCVILVCAKDIAESKAKEATDLGKEAGFPLMFTTEPEE